MGRPQDVIFGIFFAIFQVQLPPEDDFTAKKERQFSALRFSPTFQIFNRFLCISLPNGSTGNRFLGLWKDGQRRSWPQTLQLPWQRENGNQYISHSPWPIVFLARWSSPGTEPHKIPVEGRYSSNFVTPWKRSISVGFFIYLMTSVAGTLDNDLRYLIFWTLSLPRMCLCVGGGFGPL